MNATAQQRQPDLFESIYPARGTLTLYPAPQSEAQTLKAERDRLAVIRHRDIERVASVARQVWYKKAGQHWDTDGVVTACMDEVRAAAGIVLHKGGKSNNFLGCIFTTRISGKRKWKSVPDLGEHSSRIKGSHGNGQKLWTLTTDVWN